MVVQSWLEELARFFFNGSASRGRFGRRRRQPACTEVLEPRQVLSALTITASINGQASGGQLQPLAEVDKPLMHTWEIRNTGTESLRITGMTDDGGNGFQATPHAVSRFIPASGRRDTVHDAKRGLLYITTDDGYVRRYDLIENRFLSPFFVGGKPLSLDLSPNENRLIVSNLAGPWFHLIDLETSAVVREDLPGPDISFNAVFTSDTEWVMSVGQSIQGQSISLPQMISYPFLAVSADRSTVAYTGIGVTPAPVGRIQAGDTQWKRASTSAYSQEVGISRNGQQVASATGFGTYVFDSSLQQLGIIGTYGSNVPIGVVYSPVADTVYLAWSDSLQQYPSIEAWDTTTLQRKSVIDPAWQFSWTGNMSFETGRLKISRDGQTLISTVAGGVKLYGTDDLLPRYASGDANSNGLLDPDEVWKYSARDISRRGVRQHTVRVTAESETEQLAETMVVGYRGVTYNIDYGDAPDPRYPTLFASGGASHTITSGLALGATVDQDLDAQPSPLASADDQTERDDDDGVTFPGSIVPGSRTTIDVQVTSAGAAFLNAWIDFNGDGDWNDVGEQFAKDVAVSNGRNFIPVDVPASAKPGTTFSRFRLSTTGGLGVTGKAANGEVEDHLLTINPMVPVVQKVASTVSPDIALSWQASPFVSRYEVQLSPRGNTPGTTVRQITSNLSWQPESPLGFGRYAFWVRALDGETNSSRWSVIQEFTVESSPVISVPYFSTFDSTPELNWSAVPSAVAYEVYIQSLNTPVPSLYALVRNVTGTTWSPPAALARGAYKFWIRGVNSIGQTTGWSTNPVRLTIGGKPGFLTPSGTLPLDAPLSWLPVGGAARYELWVDQVGGTRKLIWDDQLTRTSYVPNFALPKGTYSAWLRAVSETGERSAWSDQLTLSVTQDRPFLTPNRSTFTNQPTWRWDAISESTAYDVLLQRLEGNVVVEQTVHSSLSTTEFTPAASLSWGTYRTFFRGIRNGIAGSWQSPPSEIQIGGPPQRITVDRSLPEAPRFAWDAVEGAFSYEIQVFRTGSAVPFLQVQGLTETTFRSESAWPKGDYTVAVRALNEARQPTPWSQPVAVRVLIERPFLSGINPTFDRTPEFAWTAIPGATSYDLRLERLVNSTYILSAFYGDVDQTRFTPFFELLDGNYRVTFRKYVGQGLQEPWQFPAATFHVGGKTSIRAVSVETGRVLRVLWRPVDGAAKTELWISEVGGNGRVITKTIDAASEHRFDTPMPAGTFRIWIRSVSPENQLAPWSEPATFTVS